MFFARANCRSRQQGVDKRGPEQQVNARGRNAMDEEEPSVVDRGIFQFQLIWKVKWLKRTLASNLPPQICQQAFLEMKQQKAVSIPASWDWQTPFGPVQGSSPSEPDRKTCSATSSVAAWVIWAEFQVAQSDKCKVDQCGYVWPSRMYRYSESPFSLTLAQDAEWSDIPIDVTKPN